MGDTAYSMFSEQKKAIKRAQALAYYYAHRDRLLAIKKTKRHNKACAKCGESFLSTTRKAKYCVTCRCVVKADAIKSRRIRFKCVECSIEFIGCGQTTLRCKKCAKQRIREQHKNLRQRPDQIEKRKQWIYRNRDVLKAKRKPWLREWRRKNREKLSKQQAEYRQNNRDKINARSRQRMRISRQKNPSIHALARARYIKRHAKQIAHRERLRSRIRNKMSTEFRNWALLRNISKKITENSNDTTVKSRPVCSVDGRGDS